MGDQKTQGTLVVHPGPRQDPVITHGVARAWAMTVDNREVLVSVPYRVVRG